MAEKSETAVLAGGCFWCIEHDLIPLKGVISIRVGYTGGSIKNPTYAQVSSGESGHVEALEVTYDPGILSYEDLLKAFWSKVDPFDGGGQFCDRGPQYRAVVFYKKQTEKDTAEAMKTEMSLRFQQPVVTDILPLETFYEAEKYHQKYAEKNPNRYKFYRWNCGRDARVREVWGGS